MGKTTVLAWGCDGPGCEVTAPRENDEVPEGWLYGNVGQAPKVKRIPTKVYHALPCMIESLVAEFGTGEVVLTHGGSADKPGTPVTPE